MVLLASVLDLMFLAVALGARMLLQWRRTRDTGLRLGLATSGMEALARGLLFGSAGAFALALARPSEEPHVLLAVVATVAAVAATVLVSVAQLQMGASWRIGVDHDERTSLVRSGLYAAVRNPIYTGMCAFAVAHAVLTPSVWALIGAALMVIGVELQVRGVEEPYLLAVHGADYRTWAATTGRFVPHLG